jgi:hypothetical protein
MRLEASKTRVNADGCYGVIRLLHSEVSGNLELQQTLIGSHQIRALHPEAIVGSHLKAPTPPRSSTTPQTDLYCSIVVKVLLCPSLA